MYKMALGMYQTVLDYPEHPDTVPVLDNLARCLLRKGDVIGARSYFEQSLAIREKAYGPDHPGTLQVRNDIASLGNN